MTQRLHHQPGRVTAGAFGQLQRFFGRLYTRLKAQAVFDVVLKTGIQLHQKIDGTHFLAGDAFQQGSEHVPFLGTLQIRLQLFFQLLLVGERKVFGVLFNKEIERVNHRHVGDDFDFNSQTLGLLREHQSRLEVAIGVLLPVDKVLFGLNLQAVSFDRGTAVRSRAQAHDMRRQVNLAVKVVISLMLQSYCNGHSRVRPLFHSGRLLR